MKKVVNNKAVIYARVGSQAQREGFNSIASQIQELRRFAQSKGYKIVHEYTDVGSAGSNNSKGFQDMLKMIGDNHVKAIFCTNIDRITRDFQTMLSIDEAIRKSGAVIITPNFTYGDNPTSDFMWDIQVMLSKAYRNMQSENTKRGIARAKAKKAILLARVSTEKETYEPSK